MTCDFDIGETLFPEPRIHPWHAAATPGAAAAFAGRGGQFAYICCEAVDGTTKYHV